MQLGNLLVLLLCNEERSFVMILGDKTFDRAQRQEEGHQRPQQRLGGAAAHGGVV